MPHCQLWMIELRDECCHESDDDCPYNTHSNFDSFRAHIGGAFRLTQGTKLTRGERIHPEDLWNYASCNSMYTNSYCAGLTGARDELAVATSRR
jgi:hypothetical protein